MEWKNVLRYTNLINQINREFFTCKKIEYNYYYQLKFFLMQSRSWSLVDLSLSVEDIAELMTTAVESGV